MGHKLPLVVRGSTAPNAAIAQGWFKGRGAPLADRRIRLHVVVSVQQHRAASCDMLVLGYDNRMPRGLMQHGVQTDAAELLHQPVRTSARVLIARGIGGDAGEP